MVRRFSKEMLGDVPEPVGVYWQNPPVLNFYLGPGQKSATTPSVTHRTLLFAVAYDVLGSAADAEDVVQETWLRWSDVDQAALREPRAYLVRIVTRQALNRWRTLARQREDYVGEWLPEPLLTSPDVADGVVLAESVSMAMLTGRSRLGGKGDRPNLTREVVVPLDNTRPVGIANTGALQIEYLGEEIGSTTPS